VPFGDVGPNVHRRLRSGSTATKAAPPWAVKHRRGRLLILSGPIEPLEQRSQDRLGVNEPSIETLRPLGHPQGRPQISPIINEPSVETLHLQGRLTTLSIY
jgi:hypothetical protein